MATYYWVGGSGSWLSSSKWASTSGGAGGAGVPTAADDVVFDVNSGGAGIMYTSDSTELASALCRNLTVDNSTVATIYFGRNAVTGMLLNIAGNITIGSTAGLKANFLDSSYGPNGSTVLTGNCLLTSSGANLGTVYVTGSLSQQDALLLITLRMATGATWTTNNYNVSILGFGGYVSGGIDLSATSATGVTANLGTTTFSINNGGFNLDAPSSTVTATSTTILFYAPNRYLKSNLYNLGAVNAGNIPNNNFVFIAIKSCVNLTLVGPSTATGSCNVQIATTAVASSVTVTGAFTTSGTAGNKRIRINTSSNPTLAGTLILNGSTAVSDIDVVAGTISGTATPLTGTRLGDWGVANITYSTPKNVYWNLAGTQTLDANGWAATSGGTPSTDYFPLLQDTAIFDDVGSAGTLNTPLLSYFGNITFSSRTIAITFNAAITCYRSMVLSSAVTKTSGTVSFQGSVTASFTQGGATYQTVLDIVKSGGTFTLNDALLLTVGGSLQVRLFAGNSAQTVNLGNFTHNVRSFYWDNSSEVSTLNFGTSSQINLTGSDTTIFTTSGATFATIGTPKFVSTYTGSTGTRQLSLSITGGSGLLDIAVSAASGISIGTATDSLTINGNANNIDLTGFTGTLTNTSRTIFGSLTIGSGTTLALGTQSTFFTAISGTKTITSNGKTLNFPIIFNNIGTYQLGDALTLGSTRSLTISAGTLNFNGYNATVGALVTSSTTAKTLTLGSSVFTISGTNGITSTGSNLTISATTGYINMTASTAKAFNGNGHSWPRLNQGGAGALTITGNNTFANLTNTVQPVTVTLQAGTTQTFTAFGLSGTAGNLVTLNSTTTTRANIKKATPWYMGANSTDGGNNSGLTFTAGDGIDYLNVSYINGLLTYNGAPNFFSFF
jgi:fibronectin-binding autotransporter adhesin